VRCGSVKRVAAAVGEGSSCVQFVHRALREFSEAAQQPAAQQTASQQPVSQQPAPA
jgi:hypothetical protein